MNVTSIVWLKLDILETSPSVKRNTHLSTSSLPSILRYSNPFFRASFALVPSPFFLTSLNKIRDYLCIKTNSLLFKHSFNSLFFERKGQIRKNESLNWKIDILLEASDSSKPRIFIRRWLHRLII